MARVLRSGHSVTARHSALAMAAAAVCLQGSAALAATVVTSYWLPSAATGTWDTTTANWNSSKTSTSASNSAWNNGNSSNVYLAYFSNNNYATSPFTAQLSSGTTISAAGMTFNSGAGTISSLGGGATLTLTGNVTVNSAVSGTTTFDSSLSSIRIGTAQSWSPFSFNNNSSQSLVLNSGISSASGTTYTGFGGTGSGTTTVNGAIANGSGTLHVTVSGGNTTFAGANTYTGNTTVSAGTLNLTGSTTGSAVTVSGGTFNEAGTGAVAGNVAFTLTKGSATLSGSNTYTGATAVNGGTLTLDFSAAGAPVSNIINNAANSSALTLGSATLSIVGANGASNSQRFNGLTLPTNTLSSLQVTPNQASSISLSLGGITRNVGSVMNMTLPDSGTTISTSSTNYSSGGVLVSSNTNGVAYATVGGTDWAGNNNGTIGKLQSYDANDFSAATTNVNVSGAQAPASAFTVNTLRFNSGSTSLTLDSSGPSTVSTGGILVTSAGNAVIGGTGSAAIQPGGGKELVVINNGWLEFQAPVADVGTNATSITVAGAGTTTFNSNTNTGGLYLLSSAGTLYLNGGTQTVSGGLLLGTVGGNAGLTKTGSGTLTIGSATSTNLNTFTGATYANGGTLNVYGLSGAKIGSLEVNGASVLIGDGTTVNTTSLINSSANVTTYGGSLRFQSGPQSIAGFTQSGGAASASGLNTAVSVTVADTTTISGGNFSVGGNAASSWTTNKLVVSGGTATVALTSNNGAQSLNVGAGGLELRQPDTGTFTPLAFVNNNSTYTSASGTLYLRGAMKLVPSSVNPTSTTITATGPNNIPKISLDTAVRTFDVGRGAATGSDLIIQPVIASGAGGGINKIGKGTLELTGTNTYSGETTVADGTLLVSGTGTINSTSGITVNGSGALFQYTSSNALAKAVSFGSNGGRFVYDSSAAYTQPITVGSKGILGGHGALGGSVTIASDGTIAPGNSTGTLTITGTSLTMAANAIYDYQIGTSETGSDLVDLTAANSTVSFGGAWTLNVSSLGSIDPVGKTFVLFNYTGADPALGSPAISYAGGLGWSGGQIAVDSQNTRIILTGIAVPEPSTISLAAAVVAMGLLPRKRRHA